MFAQSEATILHADADSFFASVEQRDDRRLRGRPVIVGAGVVLAASYEARAFGVRTAMGSRQARLLCPHAVVLHPRMSAYAQASKDLFALFDRDELKKYYTEAELPPAAGTAQPAGSEETRS